MNIKNMARMQLLASAVCVGAITLSIATSVYAESRPTIGQGESAYAAWQVQNVMSRHAYLHAAGMNLEEVDTLWVDRNGEYAKTATFASPAWVMYGLETVRNAYGLENQKNRENGLKAINKVVPGVTFEEANLGAGHEWAMHTNTTPIIEVAGDGKTAKGVWYSPGMGLSAQIEGKNADVGGVFFWEKYAGDFIKEDGEWKIWHLQMAYDFTPGLPTEWTEKLAIISDKKQAKDGDVMREAGERMGEELPPGFRKPAYSYPSWGPDRPGLVYPRLPEPFYSFAETFSYCNCDDSSYPVTSETYGIVELPEE